MRYSTLKKIVRRAAFDIGSGSIKYQIADVDVNSGQIIKSLYEKNQQVLFLNDMQNNENKLSQKIQDEGIRVLDQLIQESKFLQVEKFVGIGTEVFRKALNGQEAINNFQKIFQIPMYIISQQDEAKLGFQNALAVSKLSKERQVSWDCGAGSFQMNSQDYSHFDSHGSGTVLKQALKLKNNISESPNPFSQNNIDELLNFLRNNLKEAPRWILDPNNLFVAIGTSQSIFNQQTILNEGKNKFNCSDIEKSIQSLIGLDDFDLYQYEKHQVAKLNNDYQVKEENSKYILSKLCLLLGYKFIQQNLFKSVMRKYQIDSVEFFQVNGNCSAILINSSNYDQPKEKLQDEMKVYSVSSENQQDSYKNKIKEPLSQLLTVNWHLEKDCNYKCKFCYAHFKEIKQNLDKEKGFKLIDEFKKFGFYKINFAGGEPFLNKNLGEYLKYSKQIGLKTSIITNASKMTMLWLTTYGQFIDQIGISCDSIDNQVQKELGRGYGNHVDITLRALKRINIINQQQNLKIQIKLNSVILRQNFMEDWNDFILQNNINRWKIFKILKIKGENDDVYDSLSITDDEYQQFVQRHIKLKDKIQFAPENNDDMTQSYIMVTPDGKFYQNNDNSTYNYSDDILNLGIEKALNQVGFQYEKYEKRGGAYKL